MKTLKLLFATLVLGITFTSCSIRINDDDDYYVSLEEVVTDFDLWYIDYNKTTGTGDVPFLSKAFTISFINGKLYANNNLVGIGSTGNGYGIQIGYYDTYNGYLEVDHQLDGYYDFDVVQITRDRIKLVDNYNNVTYYLEGYQKDSFDYDQIFYDNIEYFLQEYNVWEKTYVSDAGDLNAFDDENYLRFTPEYNSTFYSYKRPMGVVIDLDDWDFVGGYVVTDNPRRLTLQYDNGDIEKFDFSVINDEVIELYHISSGTTYQFTGSGYIQFKKNSSKNEVKRTLSKEDGKRIKVNSRTKLGEKILK